MHQIGIVGGVAAGKSLVAKQLADLGATRLDADAVGHEVLRCEEVRQAARARWGDVVFDEAGYINRDQLAKIVFGDDPNAREQRKYLEELTHPRIALRLREQSRQAAQSGATAVVLDIPLLLEAGWETSCDLVIHVDAPHSTRLERARGRGWSEARFDAREQAQTSIDEKRRHADVVVDNSGTPEQTRTQLEQIWRRLT